MLATGKKNTKLTIFLILLLATLFATTPVLAATYTAYSLGPLKKNNYTSAHTKQTNDQYIRNTVTALTNTDQVLFWAANANKKSLSTGYDQKLGSTVNIRYNTWQSAGTQVMLAMQNAKWSTQYAFVSGNVDFR